LDEAEFHLNPGLCDCWSPRGERVIVPSAGQNRRVPVFGALDALSGEVTALLTQKKCGADFIDFLDFLLGTHYPDHDRVYLFLDNCSIHHTKAVRNYFHDAMPRVRPIWNAAYTPNLNLIERFWGHLKRSAIHNYYFETVDNLEQAILRAIDTVNRSPSHPFRLQLNTVQTFSLAA
jgi:transposase